jgi:hypothetical protein
MEPAIGKYKCSQPECSIQQTGKCVNGLGIEECPNKIGIINNSEEEENEEQQTPESKTIRIPWGDVYQEKDLTNLTYRYPCKLIILVGEPSCGKSTLYAALFDSFHKGGCGEYIFSCSRTPIGFEKICHFAREKSKGKTPSTERSKSYEFSYYHLGVRTADLSRPTEHLLFADVSGERFQIAKDSDDEILKLNILKSADKIFFIADGGLLIDNEEKHKAKKDITDMINRCLQNGMLSERQGINLIVTKWDEINSAGKTKEIHDFFVVPILTRFKSILKKVINVASRSMNDNIAPRTGVDEFLQECLSSDEKPEFLKVFPENISRQFQKFKFENRL